MAILTHSIPSANNVVWYFPSMFLFFAVGGVVEQRMLTREGLLKYAAVPSKDVVYGETVGILNTACSRTRVLLSSQQQCLAANLQQYVKDQGNVGNDSTGSWVAFSVILLISMNVSKDQTCCVQYTNIGDNWLLTWDTLCQWIMANLHLLLLLTAESKLFTCQCDIIPWRALQIVNSTKVPNPTWQQVRCVCCVLA